MSKARNMGALLFLIDGVALSFYFSWQTYLPCMSTRIGKMLENNPVCPPAPETQNQMFLKWSILALNILLIYVTRKAIKADKKQYDSGKKYYRRYGY
jgi:hypothetical protein